jgi:hypothetical protein
MYNEGFGLAAETISFKNERHANSLTTMGYLNTLAVTACGEAHPMLESAWVKEKKIYACYGF